MVIIVVIVISYINDIQKQCKVDENLCRGTQRESTQPFLADGGGDDDASGKEYCTR